MKQKLLIVILAIVAAATLGVLGSFRIVFANPSQAHMTCKEGLYYEAHDYPRSGDSTVTAFIDGKRVKGFPKSFRVSIEGTIPNPDKTIPHTWKVVWDGFDGAKGDRTQEGSVDSCVSPPTTHPTTTTSTTVPTSSTTVSTTTTVYEGTTTTVATDIDTPPVPTTTNAPTTTADTSQPPAPTTGLPATGIEISTFGWGLILVASGILLLVWNNRSQKKRTRL